MKWTDYFMKLWQSPLGKIIIEAGRWAVLGAISLFVTKLIELVPGSELDPNFQYAILIGLRMLDSFLHKSGIAEKGLTRF